MRNKRKVVIEFVKKGEVNNARLVEYFASKFNERGLKNEI